MKTIEEKAKAYDEAIGKAAALYKASEPMSGCNVILETIFPELKESEDEKVRKELIKHLKELSDWKEDEVIPVKNPSYYRQWASWLEKQRKETSWKPSKEEMDVLYGLAYITNQYDEHKEEVITHLYQDLKREFFNGSSYENMFPNTEDGVRRRSTIQVLEYARSLDTYNQYGKADIDKNIAWLENQGTPAKLSEEEQNKFAKVVLRSCAMSFIDYLDAHKYEGKMCVSNGECEDIENAFHNAMWDRLHRYYCKYIEKQGEQKHIDKIEPKFKIGDWIINPKTGNVLQIKNVLLCGNKGNYEFDYSSMPIESVDKHYHLWTLEDAKDGDVLVNWNNTTFIFKAIEDETVKFHIAYNEKWDAIKTPATKLSHLGFPEPQFEFHPATKEQRNLLFQKMNEAGYEWDVKNQVMTKIEQKSIDSYCQENCKGFQETGKCFADGECKAKREAEQELTDLNEFINELSKQFPDISFAKLSRIVVRVAKWAKSNQPRQEWSEEDEINVYNIIHFLEEPSMLENNEPCKKIIIDWLKSLRPQNHWKPSSEQMKALNAINVIGGISYAGQGQVLIELYNDLKKIKEGNV